MGEILWAHLEILQKDVDRGANIENVPMSQISGSGLSSLKSNDIFDMGKIQDALPNSTQQSQDDETENVKSPLEVYFNSLKKSRDPGMRVDERLKILYPNVNEEETPIPRCWSTNDKYDYIMLEQVSTI